LINILLVLEAVILINFYMLGIFTPHRAIL
jgi:hypothetical protein